MMTNNLTVAAIEQIYKSPKMDIFYVDDNLLKIVLKGFQTVSEAAINEQKMLEAIKGRNIQLMLVDERTIRALSEDMKDFLIHSFEDIADAGVRRVAILTAENIIARFGMDQVFTETQTSLGYIRKQFDSEEDAKNWLLA